MQILLKHLANKKDPPIPELSLLSKVLCREDLRISLKDYYGHFRNLMEEKSSLKKPLSDGSDSGRKRKAHYSALETERPRKKMKLSGQHLN